MGIDTLHVIDTGLDPVTAEREQWDDAQHAVHAPVSPSPTSATSRRNACSRSQGIEVITIRAASWAAAAAGRAA
jgi:arginine deiminase